MLLLVAADSIELSNEKRLWQMERCKSFWESDCQMFSGETFKNNFRMSRKNFNILCEKLIYIEKQETKFRKPIPLEKRIAIALYSLGSSGEYRSIANLFDVGKSTVCVILLEFCKIFCKIFAPEYLNFFPLTKDKINECVRGFEAIGFPQCLGAIDGCHIEIHPNTSDAVDYFNYKGWYSIVLFAMVDYRYRFQYINVGSPGRCNDSQIFEKSLLKKYLDQCPLLEEMSKNLSGVDIPVLILGDSAFRLSKTLMKPFPFNIDSDISEKKFNYSLSRCRRVVENAFGQLKARFRRVGKGIDNTIENANLIIKTCCILHNFLNERNDAINSLWLQDIQNSQITQPQPQQITYLSGDRNGTEIRKAIATYLGSQGEGSGVCMEVEEDEQLGPSSE